MSSLVKASGIQNNHAHHKSLNMCCCQICGIGLLGMCFWAGAAHDLLQRAWRRSMAWLLAALPCDAVLDLHLRAELFDHRRPRDMCATMSATSARARGLTDSARRSRKIDACIVVRAGVLSVAFKKKE